MCTTKRRCDNTSWRAASRSPSLRKRLASTASSSRESTGMRLTLSMYASKLPTGPDKDEIVLAGNECSGRGDGGHRYETSWAICYLGQAGILAVGGLEC